MTLRITLLSVTAMLALSACGGSKPAPDLYVLRVPDGASPQACTVAPNVILDRPSSPAEYDTKRIAVMLEHSHLSYYTGAAWASPFPEQLHDFMNDALTARGINVLDADADDSPHASLIHLKIRAADVTNIQAPVVRLRLTGSIGKKRFKVNESIAAAENHMPQIIDAYNEAASNAADTIMKAMKTRCPAIPAGD